MAHQSRGAARDPLRDHGADKKLRVVKDGKRPDILNAPRHLQLALPKDNWLDRWPAISWLLVAFSPKAS